LFLSVGEERWILTSGIKTLPPGTLKGYDQAFPINTFFWFIEARHTPRDAPLTVWLNGGPGSTSMVGLFGEVGPCQIIEDNDRLTTEAREFGWDEKSNMLFIDQPVQTGFSYDMVTKGVLEVFDYEGTVDVPTEEREQEGTDLSTETRLKKVRPINRLPSVDEERRIKRQSERETEERASIPGTFGSGRASSTTNTTASSSEALWQALQVWVKEFPEYVNDEKGLHIWTESYGGQFGPGLAKVIVEKNEMIKNDTVGQAGVQELPLKSLGISLSPSYATR
jgi:carboxypeptidase C (cathepsin A)